MERPATTDGRRRTNNCMKSDLDDDEELGCRLVGAADALALAVDAQLELLRDRRRKRALLGLGVVALQEVHVAHPRADDVVRRLAAQRRREQIEQRACTRHMRSGCDGGVGPCQNGRLKPQSSHQKDQKEPSRGRVGRHPAASRRLVESAPLKE